MNCLLEQILHRVGDRERIVERMERSPALKQLVEDYQNLTKDDGSLYPVTSAMNGVEFKIALRRLEPEVQLDMLKKYSDTVRGVVHAEAPEKVAERTHRHWLIKFFSVSLSSILLIMAVTFIAVVLRGDSGKQTGVIASVLSTTLEVAKIIINGTSK